jgi:hypothetical protein
MPTSMLEKVAKLLAQAENAGTQAEADAFNERAQYLSTVHSIDVAKARHITKSKEKTLPVQRSIYIGKNGQRGLATMVRLFLSVAKANDLKCTIAHSSTRVYAHGFAEDIDIAEAIYASLITQQAKFVEEYHKCGTWMNETVWQEADIIYRDENGKRCTKRHAVDEDYKEGGYRPITWVTARLNFQEGYASQIGVRLLAAKRDEEQRIIAQEIVAQDRRAEDTPAEPQGPGTALVLVEKREAVEEFYSSKNRHVRGSWNGGGASHSSRSMGAGRSAADRSSLGSRTGIGGTKGAITS